MWSWWQSWFRYVRGLRIGHPKHYTTFPATGTYVLTGQDATLTYTPAIDNTPNQFTFTDQTNVALSSTITSAAVTISGLGSGVTITLNASGGTIDKNSDGNFLGSQIVGNGDTVRARVTSSGSNSTAVNCSVVASPSGISDTFTATTLASSGASESALPSIYPLEIIQPRASLGTYDRHYSAYPGLNYEVNVGPIGGAWPYIYSLTTAPSGMIINSTTGRITWANPTTVGSPHSITAKVRDMEGTEVSVSWTLTVATTGFLFIDSVNGNDSTGTGTFANPYRTITKFWVDVNDTTYQNKLVYLRGAGPYGLPVPTGYSGDTASGSERVHWRDRPHVFLAYPGESPVIDGFTTGSTYRHFYIESPGNLCYYWHGIRFTNFKGWVNEIWQGNNCTWLDCNFDSLTSDGSSANQGAIGVRNDSVLTNTPPALDASYKYYYFVNGCSFHNQTSNAECIGVYGIAKMLIERNSFTNNTGTVIDMKSSSQRMEVRANTESGNGFGLDIKGQYHAAKMQIHHNYFQSLVNIGEYQPGGPFDIYFDRNTVRASLRLRNLNSSQGPINMRRNVIVNESPSDHIDDTESSTVTTVTRNYSENLTGNAAAGLIDGSGNLAGANASLEGTRGWQVGSYS
jgi:hypothetical protein